MKVLTRTLNIGYPGMSTKIPFVSAASQIWYWQMKSYKKEKEMFNSTDIYKYSYLQKTI